MIELVHHWDKPITTYKSEFLGPEQSFANIDSSLPELLAYLQESEKFHLKLGQEMMQADDGNLFPVDLLAFAALNRSTNLIQGFVTLIEQRNFICAAPLLRLQIDTCLRFYAVFLAKDAHGLAMEVLKGTKLTKLKDRDGKPFTDLHLVTSLSREYPWLADVYAHTSGYVHLSDKHIFNTFAQATQQQRQAGVLPFRVGRGDNFPDDSLYREAAMAFVRVTEVLFRHLHGWVKTKSGPPEI